MTTAPVLVVFGAGNGLGAAVARRFGREGFRVALVGRRREPLDTLTASLAADGIEAAAHPADLTDPDGVPALLNAIRSRFGRIDVVEYGPVSAELATSPAAELSAQALDRLARLYLLTPVEIGRLVLPELLQRGSGSLLVTLAANGLEPAAGFAGPGTVQTATRHWVRTLARELQGTGVYAGSLAVNALITNSDLATLAQANLQADAFAALPTVDPDDLAEQYWTLHNSRDRHEVTVPGAA